MRRETIAFDLDDVLAANAEGFTTYSNQRWGTQLTPEDYDEHWSKLWQTEQAETERRADEFHDSAVMGTYRHFEEALPVLGGLSTSYELVVLTSRRRSIEPVTREWLQTYFAGIFSEVHFAGIWDDITPESIHLTKADACREIGADYLVDDQLKHCLAVADLGIRSILFGNYSWNQADTLPDGVTRIIDWPAVGAYFARASV